ncbi:uncharacterized protein LOC144703516 [Wolffia australiana]
MEGKQLDLDAPLLSVRRMIAAAAPETKGRRFPKYRSGPLGTPGVVPFVWEEHAGRPKEERQEAAPTAAMDKGPSLDTDDEEEGEDAFTDAGSYFMSCSNSGMVEDIAGSGEVLDSVMGRFLLAAQKIAAACPQNFARNSRELSRRVAAQRTFSLDEKYEEVCKVEEDESSKRTSDSYMQSLSSDSTVGGHSPVSLGNHVLGKNCRFDGGIRRRYNSARVADVESFFDGSNPPVMDKKTGAGFEGDGSEVWRRCIHEMEARPPPLPESPSDSWLRRTLPTIASKGSSLAFLDTRHYLIRQTSRTSSPRSLGAGDEGRP